ncbi:MAG: hypothetical protein MUC80_09190 [Candidatus Thermoplasmatota archaeon]|nr:hypothetical protein [Candidatus Thermoplasmatota archaeon]
MTRSTNSLDVSSSLRSYDTRRHHLAGFSCWTGLPTRIPMGSNPSTRIR